MWSLVLFWMELDDDGSNNGKQQWLATATSFSQFRDLWTQTALILCKITEFAFHEYNFAPTPIKFIFNTMLRIVKVFPLNNGHEWQAIATATTTHTSDNYYRNFIFNFSVRMGKKCHDHGAVVDWFYHRWWYYCGDIYTDFKCTLIIYVNARLVANLIIPFISLRFQ